MAIVKGIAGASGGGTDTSDATGKQWDIKNGKTAYIASGKVTGSGYFPGMVKFNGTDGYYSKTGITTSGNKATLVMRFNVAAFTTAVGGAAQTLFSIHDSGIDSRIRAFIYASDGPDATRRNKLSVNSENGSGTLLCQLFSISELADGENHTLFYEIDTDAGTAIFRVDGVDEDDTGQAARTAPTTGALDSGASFEATIGRFYSGAPQYFGGSIGFCGYADAGGLTWSDFMQTDGHPKQISEASASPQWAEWGGQPLLWHESGMMTENKGSAGAMTANGTIILAAGSVWS